MVSFQHRFLKTCKNYYAVPKTAEERQEQEIEVQENCEELLLKFWLISITRRQPLLPTTLFVSAAASVPSP